MKKINSILCIVAIILTVSIFLTGCEVTKEYAYSFNKKELTEKDLSNGAIAVKVTRPVKFPASKDFQVTINDYNPLKEEIIVEDSSSEFSIGDTGRLAGLIIFPTVSSLVEGEQKNAEVAAANGGVGSDIASGINSLPFMAKRIFTAHRDLVKVNDCGLLEAYMHNFNLQKDKMETLIQNYKDLMSKMEIISDDYEYLKTLDVLTSTDVNNRLTISFLSKLNTFLQPAERISPTPATASSRELAALETKYFKAITDAEVELDKIREDAEELKGNCNGYVDLYKKFSAAVSKVKDNLKDLKTSHTDKVLPSFNKKLLTYDQLKNYLNGVPNYVTKAVNINSDFHSLGIFKKPSGSDEKKLHDYINIEPTYGFKLNVAAGIFFSGLSDFSFSKKTVDSIYTKKYLVNGVPVDTTVSQTFTSLYNKKQSSISYGGMLYLQAHTQNAGWLNYGAYIGFGALFNDQTRWAGALGASLIIGKSQKFSVNVGAIMAQVDRLTQPYETGNWYPEIIDNIPTYKAWDVKSMIGFSWSFK